MAAKAEQKRRMILYKAEQVFIRKGFYGVTMKDIIEECQISRGGIYVYFSSVDEIFKEVIARHNKEKAAQIKTEMDAQSFEAMLDGYFEMQKKRLLHMEESLLLAMFEYFIAHKDEPDKDFFSGTFTVLESTLLEILTCGAKEGYLAESRVPVLAANLLFCIKGLETLAMSSGVSEKLLDAQFDFCKQIVFSQTKGDSGEPS